MGLMNSIVGAMMLLAATIGVGMETTTADSPSAGDCYEGDLQQCAMWATGQVPGPICDLLRDPIKI